jgi:anaerobic ribonucleoside-triphosphate reductase
MNWNWEQEQLIQQYAGKPLTQVIQSLPYELRRFKCETCHHTFTETPPCPKCGSERVEIMCPLDRVTCGTHPDPVSGIEYCPICGEGICPACGCHDVLQISRVTGYLQDVSGWNAGKQQELKDRTRYTSSGEPMEPVHETAGGDPDVCEDQRV